MSHAGNMSPQGEWDLLKGDPKAQLIDVRTTAEWNFVGLPDPSSLGRKPLSIEWQIFPGMGRNPQFEMSVSEQLSAAGAAMTAAGYSQCFNIAGGFEGVLSVGRHRGEANGWKADVLAWVQT